MKKTKIIIQEIEYDVIMNDIRKICREEFIPPPKIQTSKLLTLNETADFFKVSKKTIYNWSKNKILKRVEIGNRVYFEKEEIEQVVEKNKF